MELDKSLKDLQYSCEIKMAMDCYKKEKEAKKQNKKFKCTCNSDYGDPMKWDKDTCIKYLGE